MNEVIQYFTHMFSAEGFSPRWLCGYWTSFHGWTYILSNIAIGLAYFVIPVLMGKFIHKRKDLPFPRIFVLFAAFILACGTSHIMDAAMFWWPAYRLSGLVYFITAFISWMTVLALIPIIPKALLLKSPAEMEEKIKERTWELQASEARFRGAVKAVNGILWTNNARGEMEGEQPGWAALTGQSYAEYQGTGWTNVIHPDDVQATLDNWHHAVENLTPFVFEHRIRRHDGVWRIYSVRAIPLIDDQGQIQEWVGVHTDITEQREAENALKISESRFRQIVDNEVIGVLFWDIMGEVLDANDQILAILGYTREELKAGQLNWRDMTPTEWQECDEIALKEVIQTGKHKPYEKQYYHKDGSKIDIFVCAEAFPDTGNQLGFTFVIDISEQKQAERALKESEALFSQIIETNTLGVFFWDTEGNILEANEYLLNLVGYTREEVLAQKVRWRDLTPPEQWARDDEGIEEILTFNRPVTPYEKQYIHKSGHLVDIFIGYSLLPGNSQKGVAFVIDITKRKRAERALAYQSHLTQTITENVTTGLLFLDANQQTTFVNPAWEKMTGFTLEEMLGKVAHDLVHHTYPDGRPYPISECLIDQALPFFKPVREWEDVFVHKDGHFYNVICNAEPIYENGQAIGTVVEVKDITEQKRSEREILRAKERLEVVLKGGNLGSWHWNVQTGDVEFNERWAEMLGYTLDEIDPHIRSWERVVHPEDLPAAVSALGAHLRGEAPEYHCEHRVKHKDGHWIWILDSGKVVEWDNNGQPLIATGIHIDITDRKQAEEALRRSEAHFKALVNTIPEIAWTANPDGYVDWYNSRWYEFTGMPKGESGDTSWLPIIHPDDEERTLERYYESIRTGEKYYIEYRLKDRSSGGWRWFIGKAIPIMDNDGKITKWFGTCTDIDAQKQVESALKEQEKLLKEAKEAAEEASRKKSQFLANMSHELRTPLNAVIGYAQMMENNIGGELSEKHQKYIHSIAISGNHLLEIVNDILDIAKIEAGRIKLEIESVTIKHLLSELQYVLLQQAEDKGISLTFYTEPDLTEVDADPARLRQIFFNLISNAIKFNKPQGRVMVRIHRQTMGDGEWFFADVEDTGIGMPHSKMKELFTEFYQVDSSTSRKYEGTGLGLALTRHLVELHGGVISVTSEEGQGSIFSLRIPLKANYSDLAQDESPTQNAALN